VYRHTDYRLPLQPMEEAQALGIALPPELLAMLAELAAALQAKLGARLDQIYPPAAGPAADTEELPA
jgi:membrane protein